MADTTEGKSETERFFEIDLIKGVGILAVVLIHCKRHSFDVNISPVEIWLGAITQFAVPGFFLASGFLYATTPPVP